MSDGEPGLASATAEPDGDHVAVSVGSEAARLTPGRARDLAWQLSRAADKAAPGTAPQDGDSVTVEASGPEKHVKHNIGAGDQIALDGAFDRMMVTTNGAGGESDPYYGRVADFHDALRSESDADYLSVLAEQINMTEFEPSPAAEIKAERNRLFWASFLNEEAGEVAAALTSGETPDDFEEEVADVLIVAFGIAEAFGFDPLRAFNAKMDENDQKPKTQEGTGKLPDDGRDGWSE